MTFPDTPLDLRTEFDLNGTWTDVSAYTEHGPIVIGRGHPDESATVSASTLAVTLSNGDARFSSKNPVSPYYPYLMRNVPCRVSIPAQLNYLRFEGDTTSYASCPDAAGLHITGDMEIRVDFSPALSGPLHNVIASKSSSAPGNYAWQLQFNFDGTVRFYWSPDGTVLPQANSTVPVSFGQRFALRVTLAVATGTVTFYTGPAAGGPWTQLGSPVVSGATGVHASTAPVVVGDGTYCVAGQVFEFRLYNGVGGTLVADPVFSAQTAGTTSFADGESNTWTLTGTAEISSRMYQGHFEVAEFPQSQDQSGKTVLVKAAGGGLLRRQSQRNNPVNSAMYRAFSRLAAAAYWPMEDGVNSGRLASAAGGPAMYFSGNAAPALAANSDFAGSSALPVINGAVLTGAVQYPGTWTDNQIAFAMEVPSGGELNGSVIVAASATGTITSLTLTYGTGGTLQLQGFNSAGTQLFTSGAVSFAVNGELLLVSVALQNAGGGTIEWSITTLAPGAGSGLSSSGTFSGTVGAVTRVQFNPYGTAGLLGTVLGHCVVMPAFDGLFALASGNELYVTPAGVWVNALNAWAGEPAGVRAARLCSEQGIQFRGPGSLAGTIAMGAQTAQTLTQLLQECADADRGIWYEPRECLGWGYIPRSALYNQAVQITVDYDQDHLAMWASEPKEDDQVIVNDVTLTQTGGGSVARQFAAPGQPVTGGRLSTLPPPNGCGTYDQSYSLNIYSADDLDNMGGWIVHAGTVDEPRYPGIVLDLSNRDLAPLFYTILNMDIGGRLMINDVAAWLGPDPVSQLCQQYTVTLWTRTLEIAICGVPELPYEVAQDGAGYHFDTDGTTLNAGVSSTATSMSFKTASGFPLWTTSAGDFPFDVAIAGERVTVTNITGSSSPQTATVTRSVNGVTKAQASGAVVVLWQTPVIAL